MLKQTVNSMKRINYKLYFALIVLGLCPTVYTTVRVFFLGQLPGEWSYSIAGQLSWVNLLYEIMKEAIILPLFYFIGKVVNDREEFSNRVKSGLFITVVTYTVFSILIIIFTEPLLNIMATDKSIIADSKDYIRIESIANILSISVQFMIVVLVTLNKEKYVYIIAFIKLFLSVIFDTFFVSTLDFSLNLGVNGIGYSNIAVNIILLFVSIMLLQKENIKLFSKGKISFAWTKEFFKIGGISGAESFVRNIAYILMISRMVNMVNEQGTYWVANNFIWGWLLLPVLQLGELIKQEVATDNENLKKNSKGYFGLTLIIVALWCISIPMWKPFMSKLLGYSDVDKLFDLVMILFVFYIFFAIQNVFDSTFYGLGKTNYMLLESIVTNSVYYGVAFILYLTGVFVPTLYGIALMFGFGILFDSFVSAGAYFYLLHKNKY